MDFNNDYLNEKYDALCRERKKIDIDMHNLLLDVEMDEKWRRAYGITGHRYHFPQYIALHLDAQIRELEKEILPMFEGLDQMSWQSNAVVITRSFSDDGYGANRVYVRLDGNEPESQTIYHIDFPKQPSYKEIDVIAREFSKKYNLVDIQDNLREKGLNWYMIPKVI